VSIRNKFLEGLTGRRGSKYFLPIYMHDHGGEALKGNQRIHLKPAERNRRSLERERGMECGGVGRREGL
jgi:hypothetical protein